MKKTILLILMLFCGVPVMGASAESSFENCPAVMDKLYKEEHAVEQEIDECMAGCREMLWGLSTAFSTPSANAFLGIMLAALEASHPGMPMDQLIGVMVRDATKPIIEELIKELPDKIIYNLSIKSTVFPFASTADTSIPLPTREARARDLFLNYTLDVLLAEIDLKKYKTSDEVISVTLRFLKNFLLSSIYGKIYDKLRS